jgi:hypothetical protein
MGHRRVRSLRIAISVILFELTPAGQSNSSNSSSSSSASCAIDRHGLRLAEADAPIRTFIEPPFRTNCPHLEQKGARTRHPKRRARRRRARWSCHPPLVVALEGAPAEIAVVLGIAGHRDPQRGFGVKSWRSGPHSRPLRARTPPQSLCVKRPRLRPEGLGERWIAARIREAPHRGD